MTGKTVTITAADGACEAYVAVPEAAGHCPGVIFYMDGVGFRPTVHRMADRIAAAGYVVLLPNMFYRYGPAQPVNIAELFKPENRPALMERVQSITPERLVRDARVFLDMLESHPRVAAGSKVGLTGYCMGGAMVMRTAAAYPGRVGAGGAFHAGRLATDDIASPHYLAGAIKAELYFGHADKDAGMPPEAIEKLEQSLTAGGVKFRSELYSGALHGYTMADLVTIYDKDADERHYRELLALFARTLRVA